MSAGRERLEDGGGDGRRAKQRKIDHRQGALRLIARAIPVYNPGSLLSYDAPAAPLAGEEDQREREEALTAEPSLPLPFSSKIFFDAAMSTTAFFYFLPLPAIPFASRCSSRSPFLSLPR